MIILRKPKYVLELSSSAVKKLTLKSREQTRTNTKFLKKPNGELDLKKFEEQVIPVIKSYWNEKDHGICIATALFRSIKNKKEFLDLIKEKAGIDVDIISGRKEAELIGRAIQKEYPGKRVLVIDAGSMSIEVSLPSDNYYRSFRKESPIKLDPGIIRSLKDDKDLIVVIASAGLYRLEELGRMKEFEEQLKSYKFLQEIFNQIGSHPVKGSMATPGLGLLV
jgi:hypothetical protein